MYTYYFPTGPQATLITVLSTPVNNFYGYKNLKGLLSCTFCFETKVINHNVHYELIQ